MMGKQEKVWRAAAAELAFAGPALCHPGTQALRHLDTRRLRGGRRGRPSHGLAERKPALRAGRAHLARSPVAKMSCKTRTAPSVRVLPGWARAQIKSGSRPRTVLRAHVYRCE